MTKLTAIPEVMSLFTLVLMAGAYFFLIPTWFSFGLLCAGMLLGWWLLWADKTFLYKQYAGKLDATAQEVVAYTNSSISRSFLFLVVFYPAALFVITSSNSALGMGVMAGVLAQIASEASLVFTRNASLNQLFQFAGKPLSARESQIGAALMMAAVPAALLLSL
jgi:hypothetical protein